MKKFKEIMAFIAMCFVVITCGYFMIKVAEFAFIVGVVKAYLKSKKELKSSTAVSTEKVTDSSCADV